MNIDTTTVVFTTVPSTAEPSSTPTTPPPSTTTPLPTPTVAPREIIVKSQAVDDTADTNTWLPNDLLNADWSTVWVC